MTTLVFVIYNVYSNLYYERHSGDHNWGSIESATLFSEEKKAMQYIRENNICDNDYMFRIDKIWTKQGGVEYYD